MPQRGISRLNIGPDIARLDALGDQPCGDAFVMRSAFVEVLPSILNP